MSAKVIRINQAKVIPINQKYMNLKIVNARVALAYLDFLKESKVPVGEYLYGEIKNAADLGPFKESPYPVLFLSPTGKVEGYGSAVTGKDLVSMDEFTNHVKGNNTFIMDITEDYEARYVVGNDFVQVGCQRVQVEKIRELLSAVDHLNK